LPGDHVAGHRTRAAATARRNPARAAHLPGRRDGPHSPGSRSSRGSVVVTKAGAGPAIHGGGTRSTAAPGSSSERNTSSRKQKRRFRPSCSVTMSSSARIEGPGFAVPLMAARRRTWARIPCLELGKPRSSAMRPDESGAFQNFLVRRIGRSRGEGVRGDSPGKWRGRSFFRYRRVRPAAGRIVRGADLA